MEVTVHLPGEADATVNVEVLFRGEVISRCPCDPRSRRGHGKVFVAVIESPCPIIGARARELVCDEHVRKLVLDRLITPDRAPKGVALERINLRDFETAISPADLLEGHQDRRTIEDLVERCFAVAR